MLSSLLVASSRVTSFGIFTRLPNGGLSSIAANVNHEICTVRILDLAAVGSNATTYFQKYISKNHFDLIGFSCMVFQYSEMLELAKIAKRMLPGVKTVLGGYHATVAYEEILRSEDANYFDVVVRGEGEITFRKILEAIHDGTGYDNIAGISFIKDGKAVHNPPAELIDLNDLEIPDRNVRVVRNKAFNIFGHQAEVVETARGCTFTCNYCTITKMYGRTFRTFPIERVLRDLQDARDHDARAILFSDDNITLSKTHFEELCNAIVDHGLNDMKYVVEASVQGFSRNPHWPALARRAGFEWIFLGIESDSDAKLEYFSKDNQFQTAEAERVVRALRNKGAFILGGFILGSPSDDKRSLWQTYEYAKKIGVDLPMFLTLTPYPGTVLREELINGNYVTNLHDYSLYDCVNANVRTDHLSAYELYRVIDSIHHKAFTDGGVYKSILRRYPFFCVKSLFAMFYHHPDMVFHHLTQGRFLERKRRKQFALRAQTFSE